MNSRTLTLVVAALAAQTAYAAAPARTMYMETLAREQAVRAVLTADGALATILTDVRAVVASYESLVAHYPASGYSDNALWQAGCLSLDAYARFRQPQDRDSGLRLLKRLAVGYPSSKLVKDVAEQHARGRLAACSRSTSHDRWTSGAAVRPAAPDGDDRGRAVGRRRSGEDLRPCADGDDDATYRATEKSIRIGVDGAAARIWRLAHRDRCRSRRPRSRRDGQRRHRSGARARRRAASRSAAAEGAGHRGDPDPADRRIHSAAGTAGDREPRRSRSLPVHPRQREPALRGARHRDLLPELCEQSERRAGGGARERRVGADAGRAARLREGNRAQQPGRRVARFRRADSARHDRAPAEQQQIAEGSRREAGAVHRADRRDDAERAGGSLVRDQSAGSQALEGQRLSSAHRRGALQRDQKISDVVEAGRDGRRAPVSRQGGP